MKVLVTQHHPAEPAGTFADFLAEAGCAMDVRHLHLGQSLPDSLDAYGLVISMGGPMNVYDEDEYPWLAEETAMLAKSLASGLPTIGICLGSQLIAKALDAQVVKSPEPEIGWFSAELNEAGSADPIFQSLDNELTVLQFHNDMFQVPDGARLLAGSARCPHQVFRHGLSYGFQFHVEVTAGIIDQWYRNDDQRKAIAPGWKNQGLTMRKQAWKIYENYWAMINSR